MIYLLDGPVHKSAALVPFKRPKLVLNLRLVCAVERERSFNDKILTNDDICKRKETDFFKLVSIYVFWELQIVIFYSLFIIYWIAAWNILLKLKDITGGFISYNNFILKCEVVYIATFTPDLK